MEPGSLGHGLGLSFALILVGLGVGLGGFVTIVLILRWIFKINKIEELLEKLLHNSTELLKGVKAESSEDTNGSLNK